MSTRDRDPSPEDIRDVPDVPDTPEEDPRLRIPETLRRPVDHPAASPAEKPKSATANIAEMGKAWGLALDFVVMTLGGGLLGWGFDKWRGTAPTGALVGLGLGFAFAFYRIIRATLRQEREDQARRGRK